MQNLHTLLAKFKGVPERIDANLKIALSMAGNIAANEARATTAFKDRSGLLRGSIGLDGPTGSFRDDNLRAVLSAGAGYTRWVEEDTKAHEITPKHRQALRFPGPVGFLFAKRVWHPGTKGTRFLHKAVEATMPRLMNELVPQAIELSFAQSGFNKV